MQQSQTNKQVAILLLILIFTGILVALSWQLMRSFTKSVRRQQEFQDQLDLMADELQRLTLEENALHVSNAVLDNTLSALKHETMYYPSRIRQLLDQGDINSLGEVVGYYRELYGLLSAQSLDQASRFRLHLQPLDHGLLADANLLDYLFNLLKKESGLKSLHVDYTFSSDGHYVECRVRMPSAFTLQSQNISYLLCRQIVRDHGEATSRRACAITSDVTDGANTVIIRLPRAKRGIEK
jgi:cell division protein FtsL